VGQEKYCTNGVAVMNIGMDFFILLVGIEIEEETHGAQVRRRAVL
jgi:hypothetical protein